MKRFFPSVCLFSALLGACTAPRRIERPAPPAAPAEASEASAPDVPRADGAAQAAAASAPPTPVPAAAQDNPWNDARFRRQVIESYAAETDIEPRLSEPEREPMQKILELISTEQFEAAIAALEEQRGEAGSAVFDFTLGNIHFQREQLDLAVPAYERAVEKFPKFRRAWRNLSLIHVRQGDHAHAAAALTRVLELGGADALTYGLLGFSYSNLENHLAAESAYRMASLLDPATQDWKMGLARCFFKQRRYADAVALCDNLIAEHPERADLWLLQANAYVGLGQSPHAAENYEIVERLGHSTVESLNMLGDIYVNQELFDLGVNAYLRALRKSPDANPDRAVRAAKVLTGRGALEEAKSLVAQIEELRGDKLGAEPRKDLLKLRARIAVAEGAGEEEARVLEEIVELDPLDGEALILLGQHANRSGDPDRAIFLYERAAAIEAFEADAKVRHAQLLVGLGRYGEALPLLRRAQAVKPRENIQEYLEQVERVAQAR